MDHPQSIDQLYREAVAKAGEHPNALGFMCRVRGSEHYRAPGRNIGGYNSDADHAECTRAIANLKLVIRTGRW